MTDTSFAACGPQAILRVTLRDGSIYQGSYLTQAGLHFLHVTGPGLPLHGTVIGPLLAEDLLSFTILKTAAEVKEERRLRTRGEPFPGREPVTREDFTYRLDLLAGAIAREASRERRDQLLRQFDDVADRIALARPKRQWVLAAARFALVSNAPPRLEDLWHADVTSPSLLCRPRSQDFDPDPRERRRRVPLPDHIVRDPRSVPNLLAALRRAGLKASISLAGDPPWERADLQIDLADGRLTRFIAKGRRAAGRMVWTCAWAGNDSRAGQRRYARIIRTDAYRTMRAIIAGETLSGPAASTATSSPTGHAPGQLVLSLDPKRQTC